MTGSISDEAARVLREAWFAYLDTIETFRPRLHACCLRLTGTVWDAEDLVQDTLLRGFGAIGRGDLHNPASRFDHPQAYLCQIATNLWIDRLRRAQRESPPLWKAGAEPASPSPTAITRAAAAALFERSSPQGRAAVVLRDVFEFSLNEIAEILSTTPGAVKAALHRGRENLGGEHTVAPARHRAASPQLIDRFIAAFNARDVKAVTALLLATNTYEVQGVGGERGTDTIWLKVSFRDGVTAERHAVHGTDVVVFTFLRHGKKYAGGVERLEEMDRKVSRIINYFCCPDTLAIVASELGLEPWSSGYHQTGETLAGMIAESALPWRSI
jgi:RNA polymerase sigma-70 factor (ECF subfamily)